MVRWSEEQYNEFIKKTGKVPTRRNDPSNVVIVGGYSSRWQGWVEFEDYRFYAKSKYERDYSLFLQYRKKQGELLSWVYEPKRFSFKEFYDRGQLFYTPDFYLTLSSGKTEYHETKGFLNSPSKSKIRRFEKHYPEEGPITLIDASWFKSHYKLIHTLPGYISLEGLLHLKKTNQKKP